MEVNLGAFVERLHITVPFRIADAALRTAGVVIEEIVDEPCLLVDGKTFIGEAADELEDALKGK